MSKERQTSKLYWGSEEQRLAGLWEVSSKARVDSEPVLRGQGWEGSKLEVIITSREGSALSTPLGSKDVYWVSEDTTFGLGKGMTPRFLDSRPPRKPEEEHCRQQKSVVLFFSLHLSGEKKPKPYFLAMYGTKPRCLFRTRSRRFHTGGKQS